MAIDTRVTVMVDIDIGNGILGSLNDCRNDRDLNLQHFAVVGGHKMG
jgi:hypothetical protein